MGREVRDVKVRVEPGELVRIVRPHTRDGNDHPGEVGCVMSDGEVDAVDPGEEGFRRYLIIAFHDGVGTGGVYEFEVDRVEDAEEGIEAAAATSERNPS